MSGVAHFFMGVGGSKIHERLAHFFIDIYTYDRKMYRYKAYYSLDCDNGIENAILMKPQTPEMLLEEKQLREQLYAAVMALPEKQAKRIYARYYLGMRVSEIATAEGVDQSRVRDSIRRGLKQLAKYF